jgi:redox-sensitive bicupin YhaK (pirin superfamily)
MADDSSAPGALDVVVVPRVHELGDGFSVRRALPSQQRRMVGPFIFLDQMGPHRLSAGEGLDVRPHPHIGLATVTYLYEGEILHRDSLGSVQAIRPGDVNWMTAGGGIVHSERTPAEGRQQGSSLFGLQCWVALPREIEDGAPGFTHVSRDQLPELDDTGVSARVIAGRFGSARSPVPVSWGLFQVDVQLRPNARLQIPPDYPERAAYIVQGVLDLGPDGVFEAGLLLVFKPGETITLKAAPGQAVRLMLLGGDPMAEPRYLSWNFVSSSEERIQQAKEDWRAQRFPKVPGDDTEYIPLPDIPGRPARYP